MNSDDAPAEAAAAAEPAPAPAPAEAGAPDTTTLTAKDDAVGKQSPANGRVRQQLLERSRRLLVGGDLVARDKLVFLIGGREPAPLLGLPPLLSEPVRHAFLPPEDWPATRAGFRDRQILILRGRPGHGRVAAAIRLLQSPSDRSIFNLDPGVDLNRFAHWIETDRAGENPLPPGAGFLLCEPADPGAIRAGTLHGLQSALESIEARMVVVLAGDLTLADADLRDYVVTLGAPPSHAEVLTSHLRWRLSQRPDAGAGALDRILGDDQVQAVLTRKFVDGAPMKVAADLAIMIDQEFDGTAVDVTRLTRRADERDTEDFDIWFGALPDVPTRSLAIALAVLNGLPAESVLRAAERLTERLDGPPQYAGGSAPMLQPPWRDPFGSVRRDRLRMLRARTRPDVLRGTLGLAPVEVLEYVDEGRARSVLDHVWHQYPLHRPLLEWLRDLASEPVEEVRVWTGTALGVLSTYAFDFVHTNVLRGMANDADNEHSRDVVAYAMRVPAEDKRFLRLVRRMTNRLFANRDDPIGQATAARMHGVALGRLDLGQALDQLERLATINDWRIASAIADSLADLMLQNEIDNIPVVLERVAAWHDDRRHSDVGQWVFLMLAQSLITDVTPEKPGEIAATTIWPGLLNIADENRGLRPKVIDMWFRVINSGTYLSTVERSIDLWADYAEYDDDVRTAFVRMLRATARTERTRKLILRHAARWVAHDAMLPRPRTATAVEQALSAKE